VQKVILFVIILITLRKEAVSLVTQQGYSVTEVAKSLGMTTNLICNRKNELTAKNSRFATVL